MSQYPYPGQQFGGMPPYVPQSSAFFSPTPVPESAAMAGLLQLILAFLLLLAGIAGLIITRDPDLIATQLARGGIAIPTLPGKTAVESFQIYCLVNGSIALTLGGMLFILSFFVRRGGRTSSIISLFPVGIIGLLLGINFVVFMIQMNPQAILAGIMLLLCVATANKLVQTIRRAHDPRAAAAMHAWLWSMSQQSPGQIGYHSHETPTPPGGNSGNS